ncbi:TPA: MFS transporter [Serratia marcescens]|uniref:MFS transporter n=1 Tax=Serratia TaxID=613 RepID=UPI0013FE4778|nr:MFS transporter [Serratia marcescens]HEJ7130575.1 MFS transporter [Serratia marcescens]HEJ9174510.1 MFS transporter [Serratia marcescens]
MPLETLEGKNGIQTMIDHVGTRGRQIRLLVLCALCLMCDGFDIQAMGYAGPAIREEWGLETARLGPVFSAGLAGIAIGAFMLGWLADRIGRRPAILLATLVFGAFTLCSAFAQNVDQLLALRFVAGIALGGVMPNCIALVVEYSPSRQRATYITAITCFFAIGGGLGGIAAATLIPPFGWRAVFLLGGLLPMLLALAMWFYLPESAQWLLKCGGKERAVRALLQQMFPSQRVREVDLSVSQAEATPDKASVLDLFRERRTTFTLLLWLVNFMNLIDLYFLANWLPTLMRDAGLTLETANLATGTLQFGGVLGTLALGRLIDKFGAYSVLITGFSVATVSIAAIGVDPSNLLLLFSAIFITGIFVVGGMPGVNTLAAGGYPTFLRSTGLGWGLGIGRGASMLGPLLGAALIARHWLASDLLLLAAVPAMISAMAIALMWWKNVKNDD